MVAMVGVKDYRDKKRDLALEGSGVAYRLPTTCRRNTVTTPVPFRAKSLSLNLERILFFC